VRYGVAASVGLDSANNQGSILPAKQLQVGGRDNSDH
jgi:hypothetical protein